MLLWMSLFDPGQWTAQLATAQLVLGLAVVLAALIVAAATGRVLSEPREAGAERQKTPKLVQLLPRLADPNAAGRPRPRAPSQYPAAA